MKKNGFATFFKRGFAAGALLCALAAPFLPATLVAADFAEYKVKAEFLVKLAQFVDWPESAFPGPQAPFVIAIAGEDPFGDYLEEIARTRTIKGRPIKLARARPGDPGEPCHLLFIAGDQYPRLADLLDAYGGRPVLTIGDGERFARKGAQIALYRRGGSLRFELNLAAARRSGLAISSKLMHLAAAVYGGDAP